MRLQRWVIAALTWSLTAASVTAQTAGGATAQTAGGATAQTAGSARAETAGSAGALSDADNFIAPRDTDDTRRWSVHVDDDLFSFANRDRDYTGGVSFGLTGSRAHDHPLSLAGVLERVDRATGFAARRNDAALQGEALEIGQLIFTPTNLAATQPLHDDRPYANLLYVASSEVALDEARGAAFQSTLTLGVLGLPFAEALQSEVHRLGGGVIPRGHSHQISDGGEPTFMYSVSLYRLLGEGSYRGRRPYSVRFGAGASVGYLTEANLEITARSDAPWWSSSDAAADYAGHPAIGGAAPRARDRPHLQFEAGAKAHLRLYNAFLEGQFRGSDVEYSPHDLNPVLLDLWVGATLVFPKGFTISYTIRHQTEEIERGRGARSFAWGRIGFAQSF